MAPTVLGKRNRPRWKGLKIKISEMLDKWRYFTKLPTRYDEISKYWMKSCGYEIYENWDEIEDTWQTERFYNLYDASLSFIKNKFNDVTDLNLSIKDQLVYVGFNEKTATHLENCCLNNEVFDWEPLPCLLYTSPSPRDS